MSEHTAEKDAHVRHAESHGRPWPIGSWYCCGAVQLGAIGPDDCDECGEPWPCASARVTPLGVPERAASDCAAVGCRWGDSTSSRCECVTPPGE